MKNAPREESSVPSPVLPPELLSFLSRRTYSLLIKGEAATGKTILALSILRARGMTDNFLYLSTRVSPSQLFENNPWLKELGGDGKSKGEQERPEGQGAKDRFVDSRLDEPVPFFERITNELMDVRSPTIVVDSWDPVETMMDAEALLSNAKVLQTWRERAEANIITLIEDSSNSNYDSLYDGVLTLDRYYEDGRIVRMLQLSKLSGVKVTRPSHLFTLDSGVFRSFATYNPLEVRSGKKARWVWERRAKSTGYRELDSVLDGTLPSGTIMSLALGPGVNSVQLLILLSGIVARYAPGSRNLLYKPFQGLSPELVREAFGDVTVIKNRGREADVVEALRGQAGKKKAGRPRTIALIGAQILESEEDKSEELLEFLKSEIDLTVMVRGEEGGSENLSRAADLSLKFSDLNGTPMLQSQVPWTEYFALACESDHGPARLSLVPMV